MLERDDVGRDDCFWAIVVVIADSDRPSINDIVMANFDAV